jgi:hypothetical protein
MASGLRALATGAVAVLAALVTLAASTAGAAPARSPAPAPPVAPAPPAAPRWAPAATAAIRPGALTETAGGGLCTANFVFTRGDRTYLGQAAHCAATGADTDVDGCTAGALPPGTPVVIRAADGTRRTGVLAYSSWVAMQAGGETDPAACAGNDFALVELTPADAAAANPSVPFFGGPTGLRTGAVPAGTQVLGYGSARPRIGSGVSAPLRPKVGATADAVPGDRYAHEVYTTAPGVQGDSGAGYLDADGRALGLLSTLTLRTDGISDGLTDLSAALAYAAGTGGMGGVQLALGTEPFTPTPPGVPLTDIAPPAGPGVG